MKKFRVKLVTRLAALYINFVYKTSKIEIQGDLNKLKETIEQYVVGFWHGQSYCFFPLLKDTGINVLTTTNARGNYIESLLNYFGYQPIRVTDEFSSGTELLKIRKLIKTNDNHLGIALDGPLGPEFEVKPMVLLLARFTKRKLIQINFDCKYKIRLTKRWDNYVIPLPFNKITVNLSEPLVINKEQIDLVKELKIINENP